MEEENESGSLTGLLVPTAYMATLKLRRVSAKQFLKGCVDETTLVVILRTKRLWVTGFCDFSKLYEKRELDSSFDTQGFLKPSSVH